MSSDPSGQDFSARASDHARMYQQGSGTQYNVNFLSLGSSSAQNGLDWTLNADFWPAVREVDPLELGVHRAPMTGGNAVPAYVQRDSDTEVSKAMQALVRSGGMAVLVGDSTAGKSRSAYDAMLRIAPEWKLYQPNISVPLSSSILALLNQQEKFFVWLDDLERYIGPGGLSSGALPYLRRAGIAIVATIRAEQYRRLSAVTAVQDDSHSTPDFERIVEQSIVIDIKRQWSKQEVSRAILVDDIRVKEAVNQAEKFGIAEYLAAGPKLLSEYETAWAAEANPRGASIVAAAIDCVRAGLNLALDRGFLTHLHEIYLQDRGGSLLRPEPIESAFSWALRCSDLTRCCQAASRLMGGCPPRAEWPR